MKLADTKIGRGYGRTVLALFMTASLATGCDDSDDTDETAGSTTTAAADGGAEDEAGDEAANDDAADSDDGADSGNDDDAPGDDGGDDPSEDTGSDTGTSVEGAGCEMPTSCDKGTYEGFVRIENEAEAAEIAGYTAINGELEINETNLVCLNFLSCLQTVQRNVSVFGNPELIDLSGTDNIVEIGALDLPPTVPGGAPVDAGNIAISDNAVLEDMNGFNNLEEVLLSLSINRNDSLRTISGLSGLVVIQRDLTIRDNAALTSLAGMYELKALGGALNITQNPNMCVGEACRVACDLIQWSGEGSTQANDDSCGGSACVGEFCGG